MNILVGVFMCVVSDGIFTDNSTGLCNILHSAFLNNVICDNTGVFWRPIDQDQVLTTWSEGRQNGLVLNLRLCDVTALQASKSDINIQ